MPSFLLWTAAAALSLGVAAARAQEPVLLVTSPAALQAALQAAERAGAGFAHWMDARAGDDGIASNEALSRSAAWPSIAEPLRAGIARIRTRDPQAGVGIARYPHRLFDTRWLNGREAFFELVGVVNRLDRRPFQPGACGETRLVYRLAYRAAALQSRLPMTVNVELRADAPDADGSCRSAVRQWLPPAGLDDAGLGRWLVSADGPLAPARIARGRLARITVNLQSVRWPSGVRPDMGGHAEYLLQAFHWSAAQRRYQAAPLENTPDVARLRQRPALRAELAAWLRRDENLRALDEGMLQIPDRFLATDAVSVAPLGLGRLANRPFAQLFKADEWQAVPGSRTLGSPQAVLRRLDDLSCMGCHQSRAVAGFHLLGIDQARATRTFTAGNALALGHSPHLQDELTRRKAYVHAALAQPAPDPFRPPAGTGGSDGGFGAACGLGDAGFASWTCAQGLHCSDHGAGGSGVGTCMPDAPAVGALCEPARLASSPDPWRDRAVKQRTPQACGAQGVCEATAIGFPGGMCSGRCDPTDPQATCGRIAILDGFNRCLAAGRPFGECLAGHTRPGRLRSCSAAQPCRDDYLCAQAGDGGEGRGACIPPYFLFQMRVDGHP